jgi:hypothetical protein
MPTCPIPTHNYLFAALVLLKTISTNAATIKCWAILDSRATSHFLTTDTPALNICPTSKPIIAQLPNGKYVHLTHTCTLDIASLPCGARVAHIIPGLTLHSLLSIVNMCNTGCEVNFTKKWLHHTTLQTYNCLWTQVHANGALDDPAFGGSHLPSTACSHTQLH